MILLYNGRNWTKKSQDPKHNFLQFESYEAHLLPTDVFSSESPSCTLRIEIGTKKMAKNEIYMYELSQGNLWGLWEGEPQALKDEEVLNFKMASKVQKSILYVFETYLNQNLPRIITVSLAYKMLKMTGSPQIS